jgi:hypothetical protein
MGNGNNLAAYKLKIQNIMTEQKVSEKEAKVIYKAEKSVNTEGVKQAKAPKQTKAVVPKTEKPKTESAKSAPAKEELTDDQLIEQGNKAAANKKLKTETDAKAKIATPAKRRAIAMAYIKNGTPRTNTVENNEDIIVLIIHTNKKISTSQLEKIGDDLKGDGIAMPPIRLSDLSPNTAAKFIQGLPTFISDTIVEQSGTDASNLSYDEVANKVDVSIEYSKLCHDLEIEQSEIIQKLINKRG